MKTWTMQGVKMISGDPDRDNDDPDRDASLRELERVLAAGIALTPGHARHHKELTDKRELVAERPGFRAILARLDAQELEAREQAERARLVVFPATPQAADDWLVIGLGLDTALNSAGARYSTAREINGQRYEFDPDLRLQWAPAAVASVPADGCTIPPLPGMVLKYVPSDLLRAIELHGHFGHVAVGGKQNAGGGYDDVTTDWPALLAYATEIVNACELPDVLRTWRASASAGSSDASQVFAKVIAARLSEIDAEAAA